MAMKMCRTCCSFIARSLSISLGTSPDSFITKTRRPFGGGVSEEGKEYEFTVTDVSKRTKSRLRIGAQEAIRKPGPPRGKE
ncbi:hypothetical protein DFJ74DRAFT_648558 [Hyaloraphidium curvatum]|nr:hypothetical protein DFJ74DRAFT_698217 [Hyaloraphidium curvatum]KAI9034192.1 hypothetical protein DFJ74DRAFT_648558 [Hyaloraphidium curvatum]